MPNRSCHRPKRRGNTMENRINAEITRTQSEAERANRDWQRGYYCAVAVLLREEGHATTAVRSLYAQGGGTRFADAEDIALFAQHGLAVPKL